MKDIISIIIGKIVQAILRIKGGGSALPGLIVEKINPNFISNILESLPNGVVVVSEQTEKLPQQNGSRASRKSRIKSFF